MVPLDVANELWLKALRCSHGYGEYVLKGTFVERLLQSIRHSMRAFWKTDKNAQVQKLANQASSLKKLQAAPGSGGSQPFIQSVKVE